MNDNLDKFLFSLDNYHKKKIISNCYENSNFKKFISYCIKLNITLFNDDNYNTPKTHSYLLKKIYDLKEIIVRSFGIKIIKNYKDNSERIIK